MSVFHRLAPLMSEESASCRQTNEHSKVCLPPPLALSSPVVKKKAIQIPSFDEKGLIFEKHNTKLSTADKSSDLTSPKTSIQPPWRKACQYSQRNHGERSSTFPRTKPKTHGSQSLSAKPNVYAPAAPKPNSPPTPPTFKSKPSDSLHLPASPWSDFSPLPHCPKPSVSPTLTVPTPRLTPSPTSVCQGTSSDGQSGRQLSPVARERCARSIPISNTKAEPLDEVRHDILDEKALLDFTHPGFRRVRTLTSRESRHQTVSDRLTITSQDSDFLQSKVGVSKNMYTAKDKAQTPHVDIAVMSKSKPNIKEHKKCQPSEAIEHAEIAHKGSQLAFGQAAQSNPQRTCADYIQKSAYSQASDFTSSHQSHKQIYPGKRATSKMSFSSEPPLGIVSTKGESRRRRFDLHNETRGDPSGSHHQRAQEESIIQTSIIGNTSKFFKLAGESQSIRKSSQKYGFLSKTQSQTTQMDVKKEVTRPDCVLKEPRRPSTLCLQCA
ncbi:uncharacterized protein LOC121637687 [Melanotaenia boesemani]|uniref:uncharacterized protein LOC121637687 n=1 Tax=Melanotaenia boesemani TaxID=1250792 RepID=UPI001C04BAB5|nr:uncharacterized protein LOC121637687 [Melanotaenia boesemani]